jgi:hypothetical protein
METKPVSIDAITHAKIVQTLSAKLRAYYVFPDIAEQICSRLQEHLQSGEYAAITDGELLASILTAHLHEVNQDEHLRVRWYPEPLPDQEGSMAQNQAWMDEWHQKAELDNYGLHKAERLPGNVGYLDIREFYFPSWGGDTVVAAMSFLANTNVLIVDLRKCRGGDPDMVALIASYFLGEDRTQLSSIYWREGNVTQESWTLPYVPGKRYGSKPIYILTSKDTFSGAEALAYDLKTHQRGTLIGEITRGGAQPGSPYRLSLHFDVFIPIGRSINPITGTNWEGTGVTPDVSVPQERAFHVAYSMALKGVIASLGESPSELFKEYAKEAQTALKDIDNREY